MQGVARNPLADPGILGVNAGAALFVVVGITFLGISTASGYIWLAFAGAAVAAVVVYSVSAIGRDGATPVKLALAGAAVTAALSSLVTAILLVNQETLDTFRFWQVGSLSGRTFDTMGTVLPFVVIAGVIALFSGRMLNVLALGDDLGRGLGQHVGLSRLLGAAVVVVLCGSATALAGPIGFVGLIIPHVARLAVGSDYRRILPLSALLGPILLLVADVIGRLVARPGELEVGIVTALIGAPVFILIVRYRKMATL
jgi:iron complex transport system permease protein